jgi:nucleoside 2-deoxyribosyltransferase
MEFQVSWELAALDACDVICFFFDWATMSPVTMMELGLWARSGKCVVCCDDGEGRFWKGTNVRMVCERYGVPHVRRFEDLVGEVRKMLVKKGMQMDGAVEKEKEERDGESEKEERDEEGGVAI